MAEFLTKVHTEHEIRRQVVRFQLLAQSTKQVHSAKRPLTERQWASKKANNFQQTLWVYDEESKVFAPSKWCAFVVETPDEYATPTDRTPFHTDKTTNHIEGTYKTRFVRDKDLHPLLTSWAKDTFGIANLSERSDSKWRFIKLASATPKSSITVTDATTSENDIPDSRPVSFVSRQPDQLQGQAEELDAQRYFNPTTTEEARIRVLREVAQRQGQQTFRKQLLEQYEGRCAITRCNITAVLEAAHIIPFSGNGTDDVANGLLLRADIHTLFDLYLLAIRPDKLIIVVADELLASGYKTWNGRELWSKSARPNKEALQWRWDEFQKRTVGRG